MWIAPRDVRAGERPGIGDGWGFIGQARPGIGVGVSDSKRATATKSLYHELDLATFEERQNVHRIRDIGMDDWEHKVSIILSPQRDCHPRLERVWERRCSMHRSPTATGTHTCT